MAEQLNAGIATSLLGKPYMDETLPFAVGTMGHLGSTASAHLMANCDTLLIVGSNDPWTEFYPKPGAARAVQVDIDGRKVGNRYPVEVGLVGDAAETLARLAELLDGAGTNQQARKQWRAEVEEQVRDWHALSEERSRIPASPVNPELVVRELSGRLPDDAQVSVDVGSCVYWYARQLTLPAGSSGAPFGDSCQHGLFRSIRNRGQAGPAGQACGGLGRRRGHADGRDRRTRHRGAPLAAVAGPALRGVRVQ